MNKYEELNQEAYDQGVLVKEVCLRSNSDGLYKNKKIAINKNTLSTIPEKTCVLAEELGHYYTSHGNILDLSDIKNARQEYQARLYAYNELVGLYGLINAWKASCRTKHEICEYLNITEKFFDDALECYKSKYGVYTVVDDYIIIFQPNLNIQNYFNSL